MIYEPKIGDYIKYPFGPKHFKLFIYGRVAQIESNGDKDFYMEGLAMYSEFESATHPEFPGLLLKKYHPAFVRDGIIVITKEEYALAIL